MIALKHYIIYLVKYIVTRAMRGFNENTLTMMKEARNCIFNVAMQHVIGTEQSYKLTSDQWNANFFIFLFICLFIYF